MRACCSVTLTTTIKRTHGLRNVGWRLTLEPVRPSLLRFAKRFAKSRSQPMLRLLPRQRCLACQVSFVRICSITESLTSGSTTCWQRAKTGCWPSRIECPLRRPKRCWFLPQVANQSWHLWRAKIATRSSTRMHCGVSVCWRTQTSFPWHWNTRGKNGLSSSILRSVSWSLASSMAQHACRVLRERAKRSLRFTAPCRWRERIHHAESC